MQVKSLETLIADQRVLIIGAIRQEVLSGYSDLNKFETLKTKLNYFEALLYNNGLNKLLFCLLMPLHC